MDCGVVPETSMLCKQIKQSDFWPHDQEDLDEAPTKCNMLIGTVLK